MAGGISKDLLEHYKDYYLDESSEWRDLGARNKTENIRRLCARAGVTPGTVLEIGAGEGAILQRLSDLKFADKLYALEISPSGVERIKNRKISRLAECQVFDGETVPYPDKFFDLVVMSHVLEHVEFERKLIYEAKRVARHVFVEVPVEDTAGLADNFVMDKVGHINFYSPKTIRRLVQSCKMTVLADETCHVSREVYLFSSGRKGLVRYLIKDLALRIAPRLAAQVFTYQYAGVFAPDES